LRWRALCRELDFWRAKIGEIARRRISPSLTSHVEFLTILRRDGIVFVEDLLDPDQVRVIVEEIGTRTDLMAARRGSGIVKRNARYLLLDPQRHAPSTRIFFDHPLMNSLARAYLSPVAALDRPAVQLKVDIGETCIVDFFHIDEWRNLISGFLFLTDVGEDQAPMIYLKGSHRQSVWRIAKEREFFHYYHRGAEGEYGNDESAYCGCLLPPELRAICELHDYAPVLCTGRAGTLMLFDNLGLHRATPLKRGQRLLLSGYWMLPPGKQRRAAVAEAPSGVGACARSEDANE
jgi:hypothetical protein